MRTMHNPVILAVSLIWGLGILTLPSHPLTQTTIKTIDVTFQADLNLAGIAKTRFIQTDKGFSRVYYSIGTLRMHNLCDNNHYWEWDNTKSSVFGGKDELRYIDLMKMKKVINESKLREYVFARSPHGLFSITDPQKKPGLTLGLNLKEKLTSLDTKTFNGIEANGYELGGNDSPIKFRMWFNKSNGILVKQEMISSDVRFNGETINEKL